MQDFVKTENMEKLEKLAEELKSCAICSSRSATYSKTYGFLWRNKVNEFFAQMNKVLEEDNYITRIKGTTEPALYKTTAPHRYYDIVEYIHVK